MSVKKTIEIEAIAKDAVKKIEELTGQVENLEDQLKDTNKTSKDVAKGVGAIGTTLKAAGIGLIIAAFAKLTEVFNENQKVTNIFNTAFEGLSLAFNDFFNFLDNNVGTVLGYFQGIFENPQQAISDFGTSIKNNLIERFNSFLDTLGFLASAVKKVFSGDFAGALDDVKSAGKESLDVLTGVDNTFDKSVETVKSATTAIVNYTKETIKQAASTVDLNRKADVSIAQNRIILEQKDREAEKLRQIRDDESVNIEERIKANNKLAEVLDEQERLMLANADAVIAAAQAQFDKNANDENQIALLEAQAEREGILAQVEGFRSEQLININSLNREKLDLLDEEKEKEIEAAELKKELKEQEREGIKSNLDTIIAAAGQETAIGKAVFVAKQAMLIQEQIQEAKAILQQITGRAAAAGVDAAAGSMKTASAVPFPANIPLIIGFAAQAAGIFASIRSAVRATKSSASKFGVSGGVMTSAPRIQASAASVPPAFNVVGASETNQLAEAINGREQKPVKAFVVSSDVSNAQSLDRNIIETASIG
ncbi:phage tail tape measure protein [uncultured Mediterranean phage uvMED]|nr:phage tail tape measure protein [uncultured Mediterranean phage uvMED]